jgi:uncharacterized integral membrane protein
MATNAEHRHQQRSILSPRLIVSAVLVLCLVIFVAQNLEEVTIDFLFFSIQTSMLVAMLICAGLGAAAALLFKRSRS